MKSANTSSMRIPSLSEASANASFDELARRAAAHFEAAKACGVRGLKHAWLAGRALEAAHGKFKGNQEEWGHFCIESLSIRERQARNLRQLARGFPSMDDLRGDSINGALRFLKGEEQSSAPARSRSTALAQPRSPASERGRASLRTAQRRLAEIAAEDQDALRRVAAVIRDEYRELRAKTRSEAA